MVRVQYIVDHLEKELGGKGSVIPHSNFDIVQTLNSNV